jgi:hypothetical protein
LVKQTYPSYFKNKKVLDIGSLDVNGNNRFLFENCEYIGIDVGEGPNVDVITPGHLYNGDDESFDVVISTEVFEHDMFYEQTIKNITCTQALVKFQSVSSNTQLILAIKTMYDKIQNLVDLETNKFMFNRAKNREIFQNFLN